MHSDHLNEQPCWYVLRTNPKQEERAASNLRAWQVETFAPKIKKPRAAGATGQSPYRVGQLFPGYIFARFALGGLLHKIKFTRGVHSIVAFGGCPLPVDSQIIALIKSRLAGDGFVRMNDDLRPGDQVVILEGPLKDITGVFEQEVKEADRVTIMLNAISYQARITIDRALLRKAG